MLRVAKGGFVPDNVQMLVRIHADDGVPSNLAAILEDEGCSVSPIASHGLAGVEEYVLAVSVGASSVLHVINSLRRMFRRGFVVDARDPDNIVRADPALPPGVVVIRSEN